MTPSSPHIQPGMAASDSAIECSTSSGIRMMPTPNAPATTNTADQNQLDALVNSKA